MKKRFWAYVLSMCMVATMLPATVFATQESLSVKNDTPNQINEKATHESYGEKEEPIPIKNERSNSISPNTASAASSEGVAVVRGVVYDTLQEAIDAAPVGGVVTMLDSTNESIYIGKRITLDMADNVIWSDSATDVIEIDATDVVIEHGYVNNLNYWPDDHATAIFLTEYSSATINDVEGFTVGGEATDEISSAFYIAEGAEGEFNECYVQIDEDYMSAYDLINCSYIEENGYGIFIDCSFETLYGDCCYTKGDATFDNCYFAAEEDDSYAITMGENDNYVTVISGYYYGDPAVWINTNNTGEMMIQEGEFHSAYKSSAAFGGKKSRASTYGFNGKNVIASPTNWKTSSTANHVFIYEGVAAPSTVSTNLTAYYGKTAGYDDIKTTWSKSGKADGYRVNYKKGTGSYGNAKYYSKAATRSRTVTNLADGYKYTFKVTPYVLVNEDLFGTKDATKCYSNKYKTAYTYTLKKVSLSTFSKSNGKVKVAWKNISGETGYQVSKSTKKSSINRVASASSSAKSKLRSASKGKYYYYRVRAYKKVGDTTIYGPWSSPKKYKR